MNFVLFTLFSSAEYVAVFILMFTLFKFRFKGYRKQIALSSLILCYVSYTMRLDGMQSFTSIVQFILFFLLVWMLFQVQAFYAAIMTFTAFFGYGVIQGLIIYITSEIGIIKLSDLSEYSLTGKSLQLGTAVVYSSIGWLIRKKNKGFDFVPTSNYGRIKYTKLNLFFLIVMIFSTFGLFSALYLINSHNTIEGSIVLFINFAIGFCVLLYLSNRKEWEDG
jgi:hypothetical protein